MAVIIYPVYLLLTGCQAYTPPHTTKSSIVFLKLSEYTESKTVSVYHSLAYKSGSVATQSFPTYQANLIHHPSNLLLPHPICSSQYHVCLCHWTFFVWQPGLRNETTKAMGLASVNTHDWFGILHETWHCLWPMKEDSASNEKFSMNWWSMMLWIWDPD